MSRPAVRLEDRVVACADAIRRPALRGLMSWTPLRRTYLSRPARLSVHFLFSFASSSVLAVLAPTASLVLSPLLLGVPHLAAGWRYTTPELGVPASRPLALLGAVTLARLLIDLQWMEVGARFGSAPEWLALALTLVWLRKRDWATWLGAAALFACAGLFPLKTLGVFLLTHPLLAFVFWFRSAPSAERWAPAVAGLVSLAAYGLIFGGALDWLLAGAYSPVWAESLFGEIELFLGPTAPGELSSRFACAYALGTSLHYFVWLKAIPEQRHTSAAPTSFRQSLASLRRDLGIRGVALVAAVALGFPLLAWLAGPELARRGYLAGAAYHGFLEIAALLSPFRRVHSK